MGTFAKILDSIRSNSNLLGGSGGQRPGVYPLPPRAPADPGYMGQFMQQAYQMAGPRVGFVQPPASAGYQSQLPMVQPPGQAGSGGIANQILGWSQYWPQRNQQSAPPVSMVPPGGGPAPMASNPFFGPAGTGNRGLGENFGNLLLR